MGGAGAPPRRRPATPSASARARARLANGQGAAVQFLPVTTPEEKHLFAQLIHDGHGSSARDPHCKSMALRWVHHVNGKLIFPKLPVQLRKHKKAWESSETIKRALKEAHRDREAVKRVLGEVQPEAVHVEVAHAMPGLAVPAAATDGLPHTVVANTAVPALRPSEVNEEKKRRGPVCTVCLRSGVHLDACVNPNNRRADRRCCADGCPAMLLAQECPRRQEYAGIWLKRQLKLLKQEWQGMPWWWKVKTFR